MIDYYLKKHCCLCCIHNKICEKEGKPCSYCRCGGCIWLDKAEHKCILSKEYKKAVDFTERIKNISTKQQKRLSEPYSRFLEGHRKSVYIQLTEKLTEYHKSKVPIYPFQCECGSIKATILFGTKDVIECLDCGKKYKITSYW